MSVGEFFGSSGPRWQRSQAWAAQGSTPRYDQAARALDPAASAISSPVERGSAAREPKVTDDSRWELVCGLEVHCHLKTKTKMFCRCALEYGAGENTHTCPVCLAHPGALPVPNGRAIEMTILLGLALDCVIAEHAVFARKNYFYPDLPKGYQISQYESPLCGPGRSSCRPPMATARSG